jgi:hypothetical protein
MDRLPAQEQEILEGLGRRLRRELPLEQLPELIKLSLAHLMRAEAEAHGRLFEATTARN